MRTAIHWAFAAQSGLCCDAHTTSGLVGWDRGADRTSNDADVSSILPIIPYGGFYRSSCACCGCRSDRAMTADTRVLDRNVQSSKMVHAALLLLKLGAVHTDLVFTISLRRRTQILQLSTSSPADYPICFYDGCRQRLVRLHLRRRLRSKPPIADASPATGCGRGRLDRYRSSSTMRLHHQTCVPRDDDHGTAGR